MNFVEMRAKENGGGTPSAQENPTVILHGIKYEVVYLQNKKRVALVTRGSNMRNFLEVDWNTGKKLASSENGRVIQDKAIVEITENNIRFYRKGCLPCGGMQAAHDEIYMQFLDYDQSLGDEAKELIKLQIENLYGLRVVETQENPSITVHYGSKDNMRKVILEKPPSVYGGIAPRAIKSMGFAEDAGPGSALGVTNKIGGEYVFLNHDRLTDTNTRGLVAVHEVGHALGLKHPSDAGAHSVDSAANNIMKNTHSGRMDFSVTPEQKAAAKSNAEFKNKIRLEG